MLPLRGTAAALAALGLVVGTACGSGGGASAPAPPRSSVFGAVGGSITRLAIEGYNELGGARAWDDARLAPYGGGDIEAWAGQIGFPSSPFWGTFRDALASEPGTDEIWWNILVRFRDDPPPVMLTTIDRQQVLLVAQEIRRLAGGAIPIYVSPMPDYGEGTGCTVAGTAGVRISELMVDFAVDEGIALRGPVLEDITVSTYNGPGDPCHQGPVGREQHGRTLRAFFGG